MNELILHLLGDYVLQSDWMAQNKTKSSVAAGWHALLYSLPFLLITHESAFLVILITHYFIDRYRLARLVVMAKNILGDPAFWQNHNRHIFEFVIPKYQTPTGYSSDAPPWLSVWLLIAADNTLHLIINHLAILHL